ncbi:MAG: arginine--tRNA ligase [Methanomicrobiaceae archaeon]|nr:arginine--tRNA ligase [Methanomicrobiaceae archaeon]
MYHQMLEIIRRALSVYVPNGEVELVEGGEHADLASTIAFRLARTEKKAPAHIAQEIAGEIGESLQRYDIRVEAKGPYLNFHFGRSYLSEAVTAALKPGYGSFPAREETVSIEHTSANPNGPLHVGHIRNSVIGDTLARAFQKAGFEQEVQYYLNDMGRQIAIVTWGADHLGIVQKEGEKGDHYIARVYIEANRVIAEDPSILPEIDDRMGRIERGDEEMAFAFRNVVDTCVEGIRQTLSSLNISHDRYVWESDFVRDGSMEEIIARARALSQCIEDGMLALDLSECGFEKNYVLRRKDGTSVYATRDLAYHRWKGKAFDLLIDVLGADHKLIGGQLICTLRLLGEKPPEIVYFEFVSLPEGSMSTRAGKFVSADELIEEVTKRAFDEVESRRPDLEEEEKRSIARSVGVGAIRYDIVRVSPDKSTVFDWKEALNFERQSAPYIQYAHARACSILEKAGKFGHAYQFESEHEIALAKLIALFPRIIERVVEERRPHHLSIYARELADLFNTFYRYEPVLKSEGATRESRLTLVAATQNTLKEALETLGIDALRSM